MNTSQTKSISAESLSRILNSVPPPVILDVRTPLEFSEVHIRQAINIPLNELNLSELRRQLSGPLTGPVYLVCRSGTRAAKAAAALAGEGFNDSVVVEGGTLAWVEAGFPAVRSGAKVISLERQVRIVAGFLVLSGVLLARFVHPGFIGLSAFVGAGLMFAGITDFCGMGLLLAKLPYNRRKSKSP